QVNWTSAIHQMAGRCREAMPVRRWLGENVRRWGVWPAAFRIVAPGFGTISGRSVQRSERAFVSTVVQFGWLTAGQNRAGHAAGHRGQPDCRRPALGAVVGLVAL